MSTMKAAVVPSAGAAFELKEIPIPVPKSDEVLIQVYACGICHTDDFIKQGHLGADFPRIHGHEVAGKVVKIGGGVKHFKIGDRVAVGYFAGWCKYCDSCRRGEFQTCKESKGSGIHIDGGYAEYMTCPAEGLAHIPGELSYIEAGPLMCAGSTVYNALKTSNARAGDVVAISGLGGLGHLAIQFARQMGFKVVTVSSGDSKRELAKILGAHAYIDSSKEDVGKTLLGLGGAKVALCTAPYAQPIEEISKGLATKGEVIIVGLPERDLQVSAFGLIVGDKAIKGSTCGVSICGEDTMSFASLTGSRSMNEVYPLDKIHEAWERMLSNKARFRVVLDINGKGHEKGTSA